MFTSCVRCLTRRFGCGEATGPPAARLTSSPRNAWSGVSPLRKSLPRPPHHSCRASHRASRRPVASGGLHGRVPSVSSPMMRRTARLHADQAGRRLGEERQNLRSPQCLAHNNVSRRVDGVNLKNALGQIKAHGGNLHGGWLLGSGCLTANPLWHCDAGRGAIRLICFGEAHAKSSRSPRTIADILVLEHRRREALSGAWSIPVCVEDARHDKCRTNRLDKRYRLAGKGPSNHESDDWWV